MTSSPTSPSTSTRTLAELNVGERAIVRAYADPDAAYSAHLSRLGLIPGTHLQVQRRAPLGDPIQIFFRGYSLALRPAEADGLLLEPVAQQHSSRAV